MQKIKDAVIDFGSSKITAIVGIKGVNNTFIIKARKDFFYDGFTERSFINTESVKKALIGASKYLFGTFRSLERVFVGVPSDFTEVVVKESQISFPKKKKIEEADIDSLFDAAFVSSSAKNTVINRSGIIFELDDYRRLPNPLGAVSGLLKGKLSFVLCNNGFIDIVKPLLVCAGFKDVEFVSISLAQSMYLLDNGTRDRIAIIVDVGYISTTFSLIQGDGILYEKSFPFGGGYITGMITERFDVAFDDAEILKHKVNISRNYNYENDLISLENGSYFKAVDILECVKEGLDILCEDITIAQDNCGYLIPEYVPVFFTGGGISYLRGAKEHVSSRLGSSIEYIAPNVPLMNKTTESSVLSLLNLSFEQE